MAGKTYDWKKTILKGVVNFVYFAVPYGIASFLQFYPEIAALSVGTILTMVANVVKNYKK